MRPLLGIVVRGGSVLVIKLESGLIIKQENSLGLESGDKVHVLYDFTRNEPKEIVPELLEEHEVEEHCGRPEYEYCHMSEWESGSGFRDSVAL